MQYILNLGLDKTKSEKKVAQENFDFEFLEFSKICYQYFCT